MILILLLDILETKMCKSFNIYRIFTINSTVCLNITTAISVLERLLTTTFITIGSFIFQSFVNFFTHLNIQLKNSWSTVNQIPVQSLDKK